MEVVLGLIVVAIVLGIAFWRSRSQRKALESELGVEAPQKMSKREKKLAEIRANDPDPVIPSFEELVAQELADTGVNEIDGHDGLADPVKLKVYHRDIDNLGDCPRESLQFRLSYGIEADAATEDDVRLICSSDIAQGESDAASPEPQAVDDTQDVSDSKT